MGIDAAKEVTLDPVEAALGRLVSGPGDWHVTPTEPCRFTKTLNKQNKEFGKTR